MTHQLKIPFNLTPSPGTQLYYSPYSKKWREICEGDLVFEIGEKNDCKICASKCSGCVEMAINFHPERFDELKHLISNPKMLKESLRIKYERL